MANVQTITRAKGTVYKVRYRDHNGAHRERSFTVQRAAEAFARTVEREKSAGASLEPFAARAQTFREVAEQMIAASGNLRPKTLEGYDLAFRVYAFPAFGPRKINTITTADLETWIQSLRDKPKANGKPRSETSVLGTYKAVAKVFKWAFARRLVAFDPCLAVERPRPDTQEARFLSVEQVTAIADEMVDPYGLTVRFAALTGLRAGELGALRIRDIDLLHAEVHVRRAKSHTSKQGWQITAPKSRNSIRDVPILDDGLLRDLTAYIAAHPAPQGIDSELWPGKVPGHAILSYEYPFDPKGFYRYEFKPAARRAGFPDLVQHELRHTFATLALESGALDMYELSRALGHASIKITETVYAHIRRKDYSANRARFSAHIARAAVPVAVLPEPIPIRREA